MAMNGEMLRNDGVAVGRPAGAGTSADRNELGEIWPEGWTLEKDRSYGLTAHPDAGTLFFGTWFGPRL